jgi:hypothetical protein
LLTVYPVHVLNLYSPLNNLDIDVIFSVGTCVIIDKVVFRKGLSWMISKTSSRIFSLIFFLFIFAVIAFLETGQIETKATNNLLTSYTEENSELETISNEESLNETIIPVLESKLVNSEIVDGYKVEEYREYEIYVDESGKTIKSVPTANYQYIRYKIN